PFKWTAMTASHSSSLMLKIIRSRRMPALFTRMSIAPNSLTAVSTMRSAAAKSATLSALATARPPRARIASTTSSATRREAPRLRDERHLAPEAEEELPVDAARMLARQVDDHGGHVVGVELLDLRDAAVLALDALLPPQLARAPHLLVDGHARAGDRADGVHGDAVLPEVARRHLGEPADRRLGGT